MSSFQTQVFRKKYGVAFRRVCLDEGISANRELRELIEARMAMAGEIGSPAG